MALMKMTGMAGVSSFSRASAMTPVCVSQRAPAGGAAVSPEAEGEPAAGSAPANARAWPRAATPESPKMES